MCVYDIVWCVEALLLRCSVCAYSRCAYTCMCIYVYMYACMCACAHTCIYIYVRLFIYMHIDVYAHVCGCRVGAFCLFVLSNPSITCVRITSVFSTPVCVCGGGLEVGVFFSLFMVSAQACCWRGRLCFDRGRDRNLFCIFLYFYWC